MNTDRTQTARIDDSAYCMRCQNDGLWSGALCRRDGAPFIDNGNDRDPERMPCRFEGICLRCCNHNHG